MILVKRRRCVRANVDYYGATIFSVSSGYTVRLANALRPALYLLCPSPCVAKARLVRVPGALRSSRPPTPKCQVEFSLGHSLQEIKYKGYVGHEFIPTRDPLAGLRQAVKACDV